MEEYYMGQAINAALQGICKCEFPFGCCIVTPNSHEMILSHNQVISKQNPLCHAEITALNQVSKITNSLGLEGYEIYCTTKPCLMCMGAIYWFGIRHIYYGTDICNAVAAGFNDIEYPSEIFSNVAKDLTIQGHVLEHECVNLFEQWHRKNRIVEKFLMRRSNDSQ